MHPAKPVCKCTIVCRYHQLKDSPSDDKQESKSGNCRRMSQTRQCHGQSLDLSSCKIRPELGRRSQCSHTAQSINIHCNHSPIQVSVGRSEKPTSRTRSLQRRKHYSIAQDSCGHVLSWYEVVCQIPKINARTIQL